MADTTNRFAGTAYLSVDGRTLPLIGDLIYFSGTVTRESKVGVDGHSGYAEKPTVSYIEATIRDAYGMTVADFNAMTNVSPVAELANGKVVTGRNMWTTTAQEVNTEEASFKLRFEGAPGSVVEA